MDKLIKLKTNLETAYGCVLNENVFVAAISLFPAILVANADEEIDKEEKEYLAVLADSYAFHTDGLSDDEKEKLSDSLFNFINYLSANNQLWEETFLKALKSLIKKDTETKNGIALIMDHIARISNSINIDEQRKINWLKKELAI